MCEETTALVTGHELMCYGLWGGVDMSECDTHSVHSGRGPS